MLFTHARVEIVYRRSQIRGRILKLDWNLWTERIRIDRIRYRDFIFFSYFVAFSVTNPQIEIRKYVHRDTGKWNRIAECWTLKPLPFAWNQTRQILKTISSHANTCFINIECGLWMIIVRRTLNCIYSCFPLLTGNAVFAANSKECEIAIRFSIDITICVEQSVSLCARVCVYLHFDYVFIFAETIFMSNCQRKSFLFLSFSVNWQHFFCRIGADVSGWTIWKWIKMFQFDGRSGRIGGRERKRMAVRSREQMGTNDIERKHVPCKYWIDCWVWIV